MPRNKTPPQAPTDSERVEAHLRAECAAILAKHGDSIAALQTMLDGVRSLPDTATPAKVSDLYAHLHAFTAAVGRNDANAATGFYGLARRLRRAAADATDKVHVENEQREAARLAEEARTKAEAAAKAARRADYERLKALQAEFGA